MQTLSIVWQRLVDDQSNTCPRSQNTGAEIRRAVERIRAVLEPLGMQAVLECRELNQQAFLDRPLESNRIWIGGQPIESWLECRTGVSRCCDEYGEQDCSTLEVEGKSYEAIPEELLVRAGIRAGISLLEPGTPATGASANSTRSSCCGGGNCCY